MDDLLILIITIIIGILGVVNNAKKKKQHTPVPQEGHDEDFLFWDQETEVKPPVYVPVEGERIFVPGKSFRNYTEYTNPVHDEIKPSTDEGAKSIVKIIQEPLAPVNKEEYIPQKRDWKKGVVYSIILDRKYI